MTRTMRFLSLSVFTLLFHVAVSASPLNNRISNQIAKVLGTENLEFLGIKEQMQVQVEFLLTSQGEILILSVESENEKASEYVKDKLNHRKIGVIPENLLMPYTVTIILKQPA